MSERPEGIRPARPVEPRESSVGIVTRRTAGGAVEVLVGVRSRNSRFMPGHWAFLGGALEDQDRPGETGAYQRCASRELEEETSIAVPPDAWLPAGLLVTPPFYRVRYRTEFHICEVDPDVRPPDPPPRPEEIEELRFVDPGDLLAAWERGEAHVPPILPPQLRVLREGGRLEDLAARLVHTNALQERSHRIEFVPDVWMLPLETDTLPPATHTNTWMPGRTRFLVVDPGSDEDAGIAHLLRVVERRREDGAEPVGVFLTHHHRDHVGGAGRVAGALGVPVLAHRRTLDLLDGRVVPDSRPVDDGERWDLGGLEVVARHTPGHAPGHLVLEVPARKALIAGDLVSGVSTIVVPDETGDMGEYLESLRRTLASGWQVFLPGHGPPVPRRGVEKALAHRYDRHARVLAAFEPGRVASLPDLAERAYADAPTAPAPLIEMQTLAHLELLVRERRVERSGHGWRLVSQE